LEKLAYVHNASTEVLIGCLMTYSVTVCVTGNHIFLTFCLYCWLLYKCTKDTLQGV